MRKQRNSAGPSRWRGRYAAAVLACLGLALVLTPAAEAKVKTCGGVRSGTGNGLGIDITSAERMGCNSAWNIAFGFDNVGWNQVSQGSDDLATVYDTQGRPWACRVTAWATGTDLGYQPFTKVRCKQGAQQVRFRFMS